MNDPVGSGVPEQAVQFLRENNIRAVDLMFVDVWGIPRGKRFPIEAFLHHGVMHIGAAAFTANADGRLDETPFVSASSGWPDMVARPDYSSLRRAGWGENLATVMCECVDARTQEPIAMDTRSMVKATLSEFAQLGYRVNLATELEFHVFDANWRPAWEEIGLYSLEFCAGFDPLLGRIVRALSDTGIPVENTSIEYSPGQIEITQQYDEALAMLDKTVLFKHAVRCVARENGYHATFMAKPGTELGGSSMHVHLSLQDQSGRNAFGIVDEENPLGSSVLRKYVSGLLAHQLELQAVTHPTSNDYKRSVDYSFAPTQVTWGVDNRHAGLRCLPRIGDSSRVEVRWASAGTNPYSVLQGYLQAGLHGLTEDLPLIDECVGDAYADPGWERIAARPEIALERFATSDFTHSAFGKTFVETTRALQLNELREFAAQVTDWEFVRYRTHI
ncbi:glutamine synthetase family protein [Nocardia pseudovaccinii]|uniref:glutamine synthetase family protein n=1 Tax=Nocardia pseudovaccinii TaxID=189540 RepID=UPI0007A4AA73|nr:glutamine synthetase family protein [Nocardia pseudovaccinii]